MRDASINLRARPVQRDLIDHAAQLLGKNRSDFMLEAACDKARSVLLDQVFFSLDEAKFQSFVQMLDAPVAPNAGLERLMAVKPVCAGVAPCGNQGLLVHALHDRAKQFYEHYGFQASPVDPLTLLLQLQ